MEQDPLMQPLEDDFFQQPQDMNEPEYPPQNDAPQEPMTPDQFPPEQELPPEGPPPPAWEYDYRRMMALPPISRLEAESCRHSHEKRWYRRLIAINILLIVFVLLTVTANLGKYGQKLDELTEHVTETFIAALNETEDSESSDDEDAEESDSDDEKDEDKKDEDDDDDYFDEFVEDFPLELRLLGYGLAALIIGYLGLFMTLAQVKASSVKITQKNFPEIYQLIFSYAQRLGMKKVPDAYIMQQSGVLNAFSAFIPHRQYIMINTEVFEVAYREHNDLNALSFIIAHEISHIYFGHATLHYNLPIWFSMNAPLFGQIASRTREFSCDRLAQRLTNYDGLDAMIMLMVDRHLYKMIDKQDYVDQTINERGFFLWLLNLLSSHPIMPKRIRALIRWEGSGELY